MLLNELLQEDGIAGRGIEGIRGEAEGAIGRQRHDVAVKHLERELAAATIAGAGLGRSQQCSANAIATIRLRHDDVMYVEQWLGSEGREAFEAVDQSDRLVALPCDVADIVLAAAQRFDQMRFGERRQSRGATHGIVGVMVKQGDQRSCVGVVEQVDRGYS